MTVQFKIIKSLVADPKKRWNANAKARQKQWREDNSDRVKETREAYRETGLALARAWKANPANAEKIEKHHENDKANKYHRPYVGVDLEGMTIPGEPVIRYQPERDHWGRETVLPDGSFKMQPVRYEQHAVILVGAQGWKRKHSATEIANDPTLKTVGADTECHWLGDDTKRPLTPREIREFLLSLPGKFGSEQGYPNGVNFVSFSFGYDATQILRDLPRSKVYEITRHRKMPTGEKTPEGNGLKAHAKIRKFKSAVYFEDIAIEYLKGKYITLHKLRDPKNPRRVVTDRNGEPVISPDGRVKTEIDAIATIRIEDTFGFYQEKFTKAAESLIGQGYLSREDWEFIGPMKDKRENFDAVPMPEIKRYTSLELTTLSKMLTTLRDGFDLMGIRVRRWTGAGQAAAALIKKEGLKKQHYSGDIVSENLSLQQKHAHYAFFGGRIETVKQGYAKNRFLWNYDRASAYPAATLELPSMRGGVWTFHDLDGPEERARCNFLIETIANSTNILSMFRVRWNFPDKIEGRGKGAGREGGGRIAGLAIPFFPFPYRTKKRGTILFPSAGRSWLMRDELLAGIEWVKTFFPTRELFKYIRVECWHEFTPGNDEKPYAFVVEQFDRRQRLKREAKKTGIENIEEKAIKLALNSLYGKTVQSVAGGFDGDPPSCVCPYYGAAITAHCRAGILRAALLDPFAVVSFQTDGIVTTRELKGLANVVEPDKLGPDEFVKLGDWEKETKTGGFFFQSGLYSLTEKGGKEKTKTRGFSPMKSVLRKSAGEFFTTDVLGVWKQPIELDRDGVPIKPRLVYSLRKYVTAGEAVSSAENFELMGRWADVPRMFTVHELGVKRTLDCYRVEGHEHCFLSGLALTHNLDIIPALAKIVDDTPENVLACIEAGEALRCRFLIPSRPADNPTPNQLSAPAEPEWLEDGLSGDDGDTLFNSYDWDTAEILAGMS